MKLLYDDSWVHHQSVSWEIKKKHNKVAVGDCGVQRMPLIVKCRCNYAIWDFLLLVMHLWSLKTALAHHTKQCSWKHKCYIWKHFLLLQWRKKTAKYMVPEIRNLKNCHFWKLCVVIRSVLNIIYKERKEVLHLCTDHYFHCQCLIAFVCCRIYWCKAINLIYRI